jgi:hypothetical protein
MFELSSKGVGLREYFFFANYLFFITQWPLRRKGFAGCLGAENVSFVKVGVYFFSILAGGWPITINVPRI